MQLEFYGAAGMVTGSCHILRVNGQQILLDCGMIQGRREDEERNREPFPFDPKNIDAVVLSHAHIDHSGRLPLLVKRGYSGPIYAQNATKDLCQILLEDSASLSERDAEYVNRKRKKYKGKDRAKDFPLVEPLYRQQDVKETLRGMIGMRYQEKREILPGISIRFRDAGHIMGSTAVEVWLQEEHTQRKVVFSGDLGQYDTPILNDPDGIEDADIVLMESTYGNRTHRDRQATYEEIATAISSARASKGNILIPAFAIGRSQEILYLLGKHYHNWELQGWRVFLDSPMAIAASKVYWEYPHLYDDEATKLRRNVHEMPHLNNLHLTAKVEESMALNKVRSGAIILAGSGMCNGGRIVHHLKHNIGRKECHILIVGYQAHGTLGRRIVERKETVRIYGKHYPLRAQVHTVGGLSAHGDQDDLLRWVGSFKKPPSVYLVHGEPESATEFRAKLQQQLGSQAHVAKPGQVVDLATL